MSDSPNFLDSCLRHREDLAEALLEPRFARAQIRKALKWTLILGAVYGLGMGTRAGLAGGSWNYAWAAAVKVPLLLLGTTLLCFPALYVFGVAGGARSRASTLLAALLSALGVLSLALTALLPIVLFFMSSTKSYAFVKVLHVLVWTAAGLASLRFLYRLIGKLDPELSQSRKLLLGWMLLFGLVGSQAAWMSRPFIGKRGEEFQFVRGEVQGSLWHEAFQSTRTMWKHSRTTAGERNQRRFVRQEKRRERQQQALSEGPTTSELRGRD